LARSDVAATLIKRQSAFGRLLGHGLAFLPPHLSAPAGPPLRPPDAPTVRGRARGNVILLSVDTLRRDALGPSRAGGVSPDLAPFAGTAVVFEDAFTPSPNSA